MKQNKLAIRRRIKQYKLRRKVRRLEIMVNRSFAVFHFFLVIAMFYGLYRVAIAPQWYFPSNMFETGRNIEILGNSVVKNDKILNILKEIPIEYKPLYKINPEKIVNIIETKIKPIKRAYVRRYWFPARLVIIVQEIIPSIVISPSEDVDEIAAYSLDGEFISREYLPLTDKSNVLKVLSYGIKEDDYEKWDKQRINTLYRVAKEIEHYSGEKVKYLDLRIPNNAFVQLDSVKIRLGMLDIGVFERIKEITSLIASDDVKKLASSTKYIDLSWSSVRYINIEQE